MACEAKPPRNAGGQDFGANSFKASVSGVRYMSAGPPCMITAMKPALMTSSRLAPESGPALDLRTKELINVALSVASQCQ